MPLLVGPGGSVRLVSAEAVGQAHAKLREPIKPKPAAKKKRRRKKRKKAKRRTSKRRKASKRKRSKGKRRKTSKRKRRAAAGKVHTTARYVRRRIQSPRKFDPRSLRTIDPGRPGHTKLIVGCPTGHYKRDRCKVGTEVQAQLEEI